MISNPIDFRPESLLLEQFNRRFTRKEKNPNIYVWYITVFISVLFRFFLSLYFVFNSFCFFSLFTSSFAICVCVCVCLRRAKQKESMLSIENDMNYLDDIFPLICHKVQYISANGFNIEWWWSIENENLQTKPNQNKIEWKEITDGRIKKH